MTIQDYVTKVCQHCGLAEGSFTVTVDEKDDQIIIQLQVPEDDSGLFIGYHAETLTALQRMTRVVFREEIGEKKLLLNVNNYREDRADQLRGKVRAIADRVISTQQPYTFNFLPSHDRFVIHTTISEEFPDLESISEGEGSDRKLTVHVKTT